MAFGTGSAVAHRAVDAVMGPRTIQHEAVAAAAPEAAAGNSSYSDACGMHSKAFQDVRLSLFVCLCFFSIFFKLLSTSQNISIMLENYAMTFLNHLASKTGRCGLYKGFFFIM